MNPLFTRVTAWGVAAAEAGKLPDPVLRMGIRRLLAARKKEREQDSCEVQQARLQQLLDDCRNSQIAEFPEKANEQHYEVPAEYFRLVLGPHLKYSSGHWGNGVVDLEAAEEQALQLTCQQAELANGQQILELGCGWGSLSLYLAQKYPESEIVSVSNSKSQKESIDLRANERGLKNLTVVTADMNHFQPAGSFDRVVSVEMFEHMRNHAELMKRISRWLNPQGQLYVHIFCHRSFPYLFTSTGPGDWMADYFFSGGMMPSDELLLHYQDELSLQQRWRWNGQHYQKTCEAWLKLHDQRKREILPVFATAYGAEHAELWFQRWRMFYLACAELFGWNEGNEWWVSHYRFQKR